MLEIQFSNKMKRDWKRMKKRGKDMEKLSAVLGILARQEQLPENHRDHELRGNYSGFRECHIEPDWLLIYEIQNDKLILVATETGTYADLFGM